MNTGEAARNLAITAIFGLASWTVFTTHDHSSTLQKITTQIADLTQAVRDHNIVADTALGKLGDDDSRMAAAIAQDHQAIADLQQRDRDPPPEPMRPERHVEAIIPQSPILAVPEIGAAVGRFLGIRPHHRSIRHGSWR